MQKSRLYSIEIKDVRTDQVVVARVRIEDASGIQTCAPTPSSAGSVLI
jgi:hypothetical protein